MNIKTRFEVGQEVVIINYNALCKAVIKRISVEINRDSGDEPSEPEVLITYHFDLQKTGNYNDYRYEDSVGLSKEDLIERVTVHECS